MDRHVAPGSTLYLITGTKKRDRMKASSLPAVGMRSVSFIDAVSRCTAWC